MNLPYYEIDFSDTQLEPDELAYYIARQDALAKEAKKITYTYAHFRMGMTG